MPARPYLPSRPTVTYHRRRETASVRALRCQSHQFSFPELGRLAAHRARQPSTPLGTPRARRG